MSWVSHLVLFSFIFTMACASSQVQKFPEPVAAREVASNELTWVNHPCSGKKGVPYRKVQAFLVDSNGALFSRASENADKVEIKDKPKDGHGVWQSVQHFLNEKGIAEACGAPGIDQQVQDKKSSKKDAPVQPKRNDKTFGGDYQREQVAPPVNFDADAYYAPLKKMTGELYAKLNLLLEKPHWQQVGQDDVLAEECPQNQNFFAQNERVCVQQRPYGYDGARRVMFGDVRLGDLRQEANGEYAVFDYYCQTWRTEEDFRRVNSPANALPGPGVIVSANLMNTEHTWPQSKFSENGPRASMQKADLHHIFPTDTKVNGIRGNYEFAEVDRSTAQVMYCSDGYFGNAIPPRPQDAKKAQKTFEPPTAHKGNVARALFYFSVRYGMNMSAQQEMYLRKWNKEDPPDDREIARHDAIYRAIGVRNPFIDHPEWVDDVTRFCRLKLKENGEVQVEANCD